MTKEQFMVTEFMHLFKQEVHTKPTIPDLGVRKLRAKLILEEALETIGALGLRVDFQSHSPDRLVTMKSVIIYTSNTPPDLIQIADGLADLHYVGYCGTGAACGIDMKPVFAEVHRSNMSKMWTEVDLKQQKALYPTGIVETYGGGLCRILVDGKVIKSPSYSPANIAAVLERQMSSQPGEPFVEGLPSST